MYSLIFKITAALWPFLKRAIFGDRSIKEALMDNKQVTLFFLVILLLCFTLILTVKETGEVKKEVHVLKTTKSVPTVQTQDLASRKIDLNVLLE